MSEVSVLAAARIPSPISASYRRAAIKALMAIVCVSVSVLARAQGGTQDPAKPAQQQVAPVTTTVFVHGDVNGNYLPESVTVGTLDGEPLKNAPLSATVITRDLLSDQVSRLLSDVVQNDASIDNDYVPVGYYGWYEIRGFPLDLATGFQINGMTIAGEQDVPLENKQTVEFLKGIAGVESGVASAGGLIDFVTKRPAMVKAIDTSTDQRGSAYGAVDLGSLFGKQKQVGARVNLAGERIASYMNDTNGWRAVGAGSADWKINSAAILKGDFEYQHKTERDGSGYQLLGGTTLPNINAIYPSTMLGDQPWGLPDQYNTLNSGVRLDYTLPRNWLAFGAASYSHSLIDDNVIYVYGSSVDPSTYAATCPNAPDAPSYFFCPDGTYGVYDYRNPGELRIDAQAEGMLSGHLKTGAVKQDITIGGEAFRRSVQQPSSPVYDYVGSENIYQPITSLAVESPLDTAGPRILWEDSHQSAAVMQDRIHLPGRIQLIAGGRVDSLRDNNFSTGFNTDKLMWLPQYAVTFNPIQNLTLYGNYAVVLSLAPQAPWWVDNASDFLSPFRTRQFEIGAKYELEQRILISGAYYRMHAPFFYPKQTEAADNFCSTSEFIGPVDFCFESEGRETHNGVELNAQGKAASWLRLSASIAGIHAVGNGTGTPSFDNKQVVNVPRMHSTVFADVAIPHIIGLHVMPGWTFSSRKEATRDDTVSVPAVNLFNLGVRYTPGGEQGHMTFRIYANNIADKRYWSDTGGNGGDTFLWLGAPTTVRLSAHYSF